MRRASILPQATLGVLLLFVSKGWGGKEISPGWKQIDVAPERARPSVAASVGYSSEYIFRGTNLTPESDGLIWAEGSVFASPWENGTFSIGVWGGWQSGNAQFNRFTVQNGIGRARLAPTDFTARNPIIFPLFGPKRMEVRSRDREFLSNVFANIFSGSDRSRGEDVLRYIGESYDYLVSVRPPRTANSEMRPVFAVPDRGAGEIVQYLPVNVQYVFPGPVPLPYSNDAEGYLRASGYRGPIPDKLTRRVSDFSLTQTDFREIRIPLSYRHEFGPVAVTISNTFYYAEQDITARVTLRDVFASAEARELIDFASRTDIYSGAVVGFSAGAHWEPVFVAPMLPIRPGHPEDFLRKETTVIRTTTREVYDRLDIDLATNSKWLVTNGHPWARYLAARATYSHTLFSDVDMGEIVLPTYSSAHQPSYATFEVDAHLPLLSAPTAGPSQEPARERLGLKGMDRLSLDLTALTSVSFGDRPGENGEARRGWHHFEARAELNWWITAACRLAPSINYYTLFTDAAPGTEPNEFWYGMQCQLVF